jgi:hypothetical protein
MNPPSLAVATITLALVQPPFGFPSLLSNISNISGPKLCAASMESGRLRARNFVLNKRTATTASTAIKDSRRSGFSN